MGRYTPRGRQLLKMAASKWPGYPVEIPRGLWPKTVAPVSHGLEPESVWRSNRFLVQVYMEPNGIVRLSICRAELNAAGQWVDGITWEELQELKTQLGYGYYDAVEIYPASRDVVNVANVRHLWVLPGPLAFAWRADAPGAADPSAVNAGQGGAG